MTEETIDELHSRNGQPFRFPSLPVCNPDSHNTVFVFDSTVGYGRFESVSCEIINSITFAIESLDDFSNPVRSIESATKRTPLYGVKVLLLIMFGDRQLSSGH